MSSASGPLTPALSPLGGEGVTLIATGCGTAIACVCALGLTQMQRTAGGLWSVAAVLVAGGICLALARVFGRLSSIVPSGAGLLAYLSRGLGRRAGLLLAGPYLLLTLFLVGAEATIAGTLLARVTPLPVPAGALVFLVGTWAFCRMGLKVGFRAQTLATVALVALLTGLSLFAVAHTDDLAARLVPATPSALGFAAAVGQALFLFMGFELLTSQAEHAAPRAIAKGLTGTVAVLAAFYALLALGLACLPPGEALPQLALAHGPALPLTVAVCLLASFTSFNGALLALSRFLGALAAQGALPRRLARVEPRRLVPTTALNVLLMLSIAATALVLWGHALEPAILAAAVAAALLYAAAAWVREGRPFAEEGRSPVLRIGGRSLAVALAALAVGVLTGSSVGTLAILLGAFSTSALLTTRIRRA